MIRNKGKGDWEQFPCALPVLFNTKRSSLKSQLPHLQLPFHQAAGSDL